jgi:hypothetical protein
MCNSHLLRWNPNLSTDNSFVEALRTSPTSSKISALFISTIFGRSFDRVEPMIHRVGAGHGPEGFGAMVSESVGDTHLVQSPVIVFQNLKSDYR